MVRFLSSATANLIALKIGETGLSVLMMMRLFLNVEAMAGYCQSVMTAASNSSGAVTAVFHFSLAKKLRWRMRTMPISSEGSRAYRAMWRKNAGVIR